MNACKEKSSFIYTVLLAMVLFLIFSVSHAQTYIKGPALIEGVTSTATAGATTTLTVNSQTNQMFTGATTQTVVLPDATTLPVGRRFYITDRSTGGLTINANGGGLIKTIFAGTEGSFILKDNSSAAGVWDVTNYIVNASGGIVGIVPIANGGTNNSTFTNKSVPFFDGTKLAENNANFFWDNSLVSLNIGATGGASAGLGITKSINGQAGIVIANSNAGASASSTMSMLNGTDVGLIGQFGTAHATAAHLLVISQLVGNGIAINVPASKPITLSQNNVVKATIPATGGFSVNNGGVALTTTATGGFLYLPATAGTPTGVPTAVAGSAATTIDTTNSKFYYYSGGAWKLTAEPGGASGAIQYNNSGAFGGSTSTIDSTGNMIIGDGNSNISMNMPRSTGVDNGSTLTITSSGAKAAATDASAGTLFIKGGISTGTGESLIELQTSSTSFSTGSSDNAVTTKLKLTGYGELFVGDTSYGVPNPYLYYDPTLPGLCVGCNATEFVNGGSLVFGGDNTAAQISPNRALAAGTGNNLIVKGGRPLAGQTNANGGQLLLRTGQPTGSGTSLILFQTQDVGSSGTTNNAGAFNRRMSIDMLGNVVIGSTTASLATTATNGFLYIPSMAGVPSGVPTTFTGTSPLTVDTTNSKLYFYSGGAWVKAFSGSVNLTTDVTGTLPVGNGGTGATSFTDRGVLIGRSTGAIEATASGTSGQILQSTGGATNPAYTSATYPSSTTANQILYSSSNNQVGGLTSAATSALVTNSSSVPSFTSGSTANRVLRTDGTTVSFAQVAAATDVSGQLPLANGGTNKNIGAVAGAIVFSDADSFELTAAGTTGQLLTSNGSGTPTWTTSSTGTNTPTLTNSTNVAASTSNTAFYIRVGDIVTVHGRVDIDPTSAGTNTVLGISLPVASNFTAAADLAGLCTNSGGMSRCQINADDTNDRASLAMIPTGAANENVFYTYSYIVK